MIHRALASSVYVEDGALTSRAVTGESQTFPWEKVVTYLAHSKEHFKTSSAEYCEWGPGGARQVKLPLYVYS